MTPSPYFMKPKATKLAEGPDDSLEPAVEPVDPAKRSAAPFDWAQFDKSKGPNGKPDAPQQFGAVDSTRRTVPPLNWPRGIGGKMSNRPLRELAMPGITLDPDIALWQAIIVSIWPFTGPPDEGSWPKGWIGVDNTATPYICVVAGEPGTWEQLSVVGLNIFNIVNFGADPTGSHDSSSAVQAAGEAALAAGGTVFAPAGTFLLDEGVDWEMTPGQMLVLHGAGRELTYFVCSPSIATEPFRTRYGSVWMTDFWVNMNGANVAGIVTQNAYLNQTEGGAITGATTDNSTTITLSVAPTAGSPFADLLVAGNPITIDNLGHPAMGDTTPAYSGTLADTWTSGTTLTVTTNANYPSGATTAVTGQKVRVGSGAPFVTEMTFERLGLSQCGAGAQWGLIGWNTSQSYPFNIGQMTAWDILIEQWNSTGSTGQECVTASGVQQVDFRRIKMDNSSAAAAALTCRGPFGCYAYDYAYVSDVVFLASVAQNDDVSTVNLEFGGQGNIDIHGFYVAWPGTNVGKFYLGANAANLVGIHFPSNVQVNIGGIGGLFIGQGPGSYAFSGGCELMGGMNIENPQTQIAFDSSCTISGTHTLTGCINFVSTADWGTVDAGTLNLGGAILNSDDVTNVLHSDGAVTVLLLWDGQLLNPTSPLFGSNITLADGSAVHDVTGVNPVGGTVLPGGTAFALPLTTVAYTNNSGTDIMLYSIGTALTSTLLDGVSAGAAGPWLVKVGGTWTPTYTGSPTVEPVYL